MTLDIASVEASARRFYKALATAQFSKSHGSLRDFPEQCCHHASILFAIFLTKERGLQTQVVCGKRSESLHDRHVWVELPNGNVVDLTCGQFSDQRMLDYYVGPAGDWYRLWSRIADESYSMTMERAENHLVGWYREPYALVVAALAD